jgi:hypothetical protein
MSLNEFMRFVRVPGYEDEIMLAIESVLCA